MNDQQMTNTLDKIFQLLLFQTLEGKTTQEQIKIMAAVGLSPKEIAKKLGKTPNSISVALYTLKTKVKSK